MNSRSLMRIVLLCALPLTSTACGWIFTNGPPANHERLNFFTCSQGRGAPAVDIIWTGISAIAVVTVLTSSDAEFNSNFSEISRGAAAATYGVWGAATAVSGISGLKKVNECRAATALLQERLSRAPVTPSAAPSLEAIGLRPPRLFPARRPLDSAPIMLTRPKPEVSPGN